MQRGFTLFELLITIVITGIVATVGGKILTQVSRSFVTSKNAVTLDQQSTAGIPRITDDLTVIRAPADIATATATQLEFTTSDGTQIQYNLSGTTLNRALFSGGWTDYALMNHVASVNFSYYNSSGTLLVPPITVANVVWLKAEVTLTRGDTIVNVATPLVKPRSF